MIISHHKTKMTNYIRIVISDRQSEKEFFIPLERMTDFFVINYRLNICKMMPRFRYNHNGEDEKRHFQYLIDFSESSLRINRNVVASYRFVDDSRFDVYSIT